MKIGDVTRSLEISADTLRYYERIRLLPSVGRSVAGVRHYSEKDLGRIRFIQQAQKMGFSLQEISELLHFRENPGEAKPQVQELARDKLRKVEIHLDELRALRRELKQLIEQCSSTVEDCPILSRLDKVS
jgi:DNA-binding transcriptional MerR regulator